MTLIIILTVLNGLFALLTVWMASRANLDASMAKIRADRAQEAEQVARSYKERLYGAVTYRDSRG